MASEHFLHLSNLGSDPKAPAYITIHGLHAYKRMFKLSANMQLYQLSAKPGTLYICILYFDKEIFRPRNETSR